jgi:hypothetical protein
VSDSRGTRSSPPVLVDTLRYPRDFSLSLLCSVLLHVLAATVLLQEVHFPSIDSVRDVFLVPDWTAPAIQTPQAPSGGTPAPPRRSPAPARVSRRAAVASVAPRTIDQRVANNVEARKVPTAVEPSAPRITAEASARKPADRPAGTAPPKPAEISAGKQSIIAPAVALDAVAPLRPQSEVTVVPRVAERSSGAVDRGKAQAPLLQPGVTNSDQRTIPPPSEWRDAQPLVPVPPLVAVSPADAPGAKPSTDVLAQASSLGIPVPPTPEPAVASVVPPPPVSSPLDWEVPSAKDRGSSSVGRTKDGADTLTGAGMAAAPTPSVAGALTPQVPPEGRVSSVARPADRPTAPQPGGSVQPLIGKSDVPAPAMPPAPNRLSQLPAAGDANPIASGSAATPTTTPAPSGEGRAAGSPEPGDRAVAPAVSAPRAEPTGSPTIAPGVPSAITPGTSGIDTRTGARESAVGGGASAEAPPDTGSGRAGPVVAQRETRGSSQERAGTRGPGRVAITAPQSGHTLSPDDPPIVIVRGRVDDPEVSTVWLAANSRRIPLRVRDGKFEYPLVVIDRTTTISAEAPSSAVRRSEPIIVHAAPNAVTTGVVILDWGEARPAGVVEMVATWRARADRLEGQQGKVLVRAAPLPEDIPFSAFYVRNMNSGVYTFVLGYRGFDAATRMTPRFYLTTPGTPTVRDLTQVSLSGSGKTVAVRIMVPQAVLWEQDDWFTGRSEASDTITKFRDDGTSWIERKGEVR